MNTFQKLALVVALAVSPAWMVSAHATQNPTQAVSNAAAPMTEGEVKKINKETGKITLRHGEIKNLNMPGMTMVFRVKDSAMLDQVKAGDAVNFIAERLEGQFTVTKIEVRN